MGARILLPIVGTLTAYIVFHALQILLSNLTSPLRGILPSPPIPNYLLGNFRQMAEDPKLSSEWRKDYGNNFLFHGLFSIGELHTSDLKAVSHIVSHADIYQRPGANRDASRRMMGEGILFAELDQHKRQRRVLNPAFGVPQIRAVTEIFAEKAIQLRDIWTEQIRQQGGNNQVEVFSGLRKMTLDVIGRAGFGYEFNALEQEGGTNELNQAFTDLFHSPKSNLFQAIRLAQGHIPILKLLPLPGRQVVLSARQKMDEIGSQIVQRSKANIIAEDQVKSLGTRRDLLSILLKANMSPGLPESQRMNESEIISQIPAFFVAGHETTSAATAWALHALSMNKPIQDKLREELLQLETDNPTLDELGALPYLDKFLRETLRLHAPVVFMQRKAMADDVLPLAKPIIDSKGREHTSLPIRKGQMIHLPIWAINTAKETWGEDALEFRPDRWDNIPEAVSGVPGVWGNLFTFLAGPHNCIGFRFSIAELKVLLFTLVRAFEISPAVPDGGIVTVTAGVMQRPSVLAEKEKGSGLPLILTPLQNVE
ncbi:hypothetical protein MIND_01414400 [Mycena indigotica]|uniref:Cytochrome P450 n=1 Tax=Mycena indigotica TaxID=2126181 RepID=A0A8H6VT11_9AGAR|nr:uncharacterized protein MIND_01414400 [Mycena indigotica]KAF7288978.1 hypothetical protein MIND_01414400 [Mycena indigotica]